MPRVAAATDRASQIALESARFLPLSKMYCTPWRELAWVYSTAVFFTTSSWRNECLARGTIHIWCPSWRGEGVLVIFCPILWISSSGKSQKALLQTRKELFQSGRVQQGKKGHPKWTTSQKIIFLKMCLWPSAASAWHMLLWPNHDWRTFGVCGAEKVFSFLFLTSYFWV